MYYYAFNKHVQGWMHYRESSGSTYACHLEEDDGSFQQQLTASIFDPCTPSYGKKKKFEFLMHVCVCGYLKLGSKAMQERECGPK